MNEAVYIHGTEREEQERLALLNRLTNSAFVEFLELEAGDSVLEVGSGLGILAGEVARHVSLGKVYGVEYSAAQLKLARRSSQNLHLVQADAHHLPFEDEGLDVAYCRYVLEHVADPAQVLGEMRRVLKPGGKIFVQENNILVIVFYPECPRFTRLWEKFAVLQERLGGDALIGKKLLSLLQRAGFGEIKLSIQPEIHYSGKSSFRPWIENQIGNVESAVEQLLTHGLATSEEIDSAIAELRAFLSLDDACAFFYWNRASGVKTFPE
jgi:SAM-dependent methyltransferase